MALSPTTNTPVNPTLAPQTEVPPIATAATLPSSEASTVLSSDFETFLKMLTAQAEYQDPLEPIDSSEYASQLAQFSMVEQQVLANDRLAEMTAQLDIANMSQIASLIGYDARSNEPVYFNGDGITVAPEPAKEADQAYLVAYNDEGFEVYRREITVSDKLLTWSGRDSEGLTFPEGYYSFEVESYEKGNKILTEPAATYTRIVEARRIEGEAGFILEGGSELLARNLTGLRDRS